MVDLIKLADEELRLKVVRTWLDADRAVDFWTYTVYLPKLPAETREHNGTLAETFLAAAAYSRELLPPGIRCSLIVLDRDRHRFNLAYVTPPDEEVFAAIYLLHDGTPQGPVLGLGATDDAALDDAESWLPKVDCKKGMLTALPCSKLLYARVSLCGGDAPYLIRDGKVVLRDE